MERSVKIMILFCIALYSCDTVVKNNAEIYIIEDTTSILQIFNVKQELSIQTFEINTNKKQEIKGNQGTLVIFPADCFGKVQGSVKIELIECYSIQDMMFNSLSTQTTDGKLLESDGMIYLNALNEKGDTLQIKHGKVKVQMLTKERKVGIQVFEGVEKDNNITWSLLPNKIKQEIKPENILTEEIMPCCDDSILINKPKKEQSKIVADKQIKNEFLVNYVFNITKMGWINCDRFIEGETQNIIVSVSKTQENASLYLVLDKLNSNVMPRNPKAVNGQFEFRNIPINESFTLVALATKGEEIYFGMSNFVNNGAIIQCPELKPITRQGLLDKLLEKFGKDIWSRPLA